MVARHKRCWKKEQQFFDPRHYLKLLERKPGAFDYARPLKEWELADCFSTLRRRQEAVEGEGTREFIKVLRLLESATLSQLTVAVEKALEIGATSVEAVKTAAAMRAGAAQRMVPTGRSAASGGSASSRAQPGGVRLAGR